MRFLILTILPCIIFLNPVLKTMLKMRKTLKINEIPNFNYNSLYFDRSLIKNHIKDEKKLKNQSDP